MTSTRSVGYKSSASTQGSKAYVLHVIHIRSFQARVWSYTVHKILRM